MPHPLPPKSPGLPPSGPPPKDNAPRDARRRRQPAKKGRPTDAEGQKIAETVLAMMGSKPPEAIARVVHRDTTAIKAVIKSARQSMQSRAEDYVEAHWNATKVAADLGDAKPAQWALERISEGEQRVVEKEKAGTSSPSISIGIALGGVPQPKAPIEVKAIEVKEIPASTGFALPEADMP